MPSMLRQFFLCIIGLRLSVVYAVSCYACLILAATFVLESCWALELLAVYIKVGLY